MICEELHSEGGLQESFAFRELLSRFEPNELYGTEILYEYGGEIISTLPFLSNQRRTKNILLFTVNTITRF